VGFTPKAVIVASAKMGFGWDNTKYQITAGGIALPNSPSYTHYDSSKLVIIEIVDTGFKAYS
jgi:hypothetical protein